MGAYIYRLPDLINTLVAEEYIIKVHKVLDVVVSQSDLVSHYQTMGVAGLYIDYMTYDILIEPEM
jgi:hypothetical protein